MAAKPRPLPEAFDADDSGWLAEEDDLDRRSLWRLGWWAAGSVAAVTVAVMASQSSIGLRREQIANADLVRQSQQIASIAKESQSEARRLASAIDTLNGDRDRLYSRVTVLEQGLDSVTGSVARQNSAGAAPSSGAPPPPLASAPATTLAALSDKSRDAAATPATPLMPPRSVMAPPDPAATKLVEPEPPKVITATPTLEPVVAAATASDTAVSEIAAQRTEFGVDLGGAGSIEGLRALWRGVLQSGLPALETLRPIIVVKERGNGPGMQLRLVAGPLSDAAAAAKICAGLIESQHPCETSVFDGQRLAMKAEDAAPVPRPAPRKRTAARRVGNEEPGRPKVLAPPATFPER